MSRKNALTVLLSFVVTVLLMGYLLSQVDINVLKQTFLKIHFPALAAYIAVYIVSVWLRGWRYKLLLQPLDIGWRDISLVTLIRNCFDDLLPARIGSLSYVYVLNRRLGFPFEHAASSFIVSFVFDFLTLGPFVVLAVLAVGTGQTTFSASTLILLAAGFFLVIFLILWRIVPLAVLFLRFLKFIIRLLKAEGRKWAVLSLEKSKVVIDSLAAIKRRRLGAVLFIQSFFIRLAKYVSVYFLLFSLLRSHGYSLGDLSIWKTILGITGAEFTSALPVKGIAGFGTWETAWALTFELLRFPPGLSKISGIGVHLVTNLLEYSLGAFSILILALPYLKKRSGRPGKASSA